MTAPIVNRNIRHPQKHKASNRHTSEKVRDKVRCFFRLAKIIAETASLELVAKGIAMKEMKKEGIFVALEKLWTASTSGSANAAAIAVPRSKRAMALKQVQVGFSIDSPSSSSLSSSAVCSSLVVCTIAG
jgi:hypothetical protein